MKPTITRCHFSRYRFGTSVSGPKDNTPARDFVAFLHELNVYRGGKAFQNALIRADLELSDYWPKRYQLGGSIFVEPLIKRVLDGITDFDAFNGETFQELLFFINERVKDAFVVIELRHNETLFGFVMVDARSEAGVYLQRIFMNYGQARVLK
jgi:hypothetical protein